jgi:uncharacterized protein (UPF0276 family)
VKFVDKIAKVISEMIAEIAAKVLIENFSKY